LHFRSFRYLVDGFITTPIADYYLKRLTLTTMICLILGVFAASYESKESKRKFCAIIGAISLTEEALVRLSKFTAMVRFLFDLPLYAALQV
jgi:hypothetical protein